MSYRNPGLGDVTQLPPGINPGSYNDAQQRTLPKQRPSFDRPSPKGKPRRVRHTQMFWLNMDVPFTSTAGENKQASTELKNFDLLIRGAWANLDGARTRFTNTSTGLPLTTELVPILSLVGGSALAHPVLYWRKPFLLKANAALRGDFINDGSEAAGDVVFVCERPERDAEIEVAETISYVLLLDLGLTGGASGTGTAVTQQIQNDLLIYGALSTSIGMEVRFSDTRENTAWSSEKLPVGAFCGIADGSNVQPIVYFPTPYLLRQNSSILAEWTNAGNESGKYVSFICERILR